MRPAIAADAPFIERLYTERRAAEFAALGLGADQMRAMIAMQFAAWRCSYAGKPSVIEFVLLDSAGEPAGHLVISQATGLSRIIDVSVATTHRGQGLATAALQEVISTAHKSECDVGLLVAPGSPAKKLYERLGFVSDGPGDPAGLPMMCRYSRTQRFIAGYPA